MKRYGKYLLERQLAIGGMAEVFLARQHGPAGFEKQLVIKRILPHFANDEQFIQMFLDEARTAAKLNHPNIVQIYELGETDGSYYIAMEYLRGETLAKVIRRLRQHGMHMPLHLAAKIIASVCAGLEYAHSFSGEDGQPLGLVHRDISPDNVLVSFDGAVKMIDFGIAKARDNDAKTQAGSVKGKFCYMSPEQVTGRRLDGRSDLFSLGIVLHELTTLEKPFGSDADLMTVSAIVNDAPRSAPDIVEGYPAALWEIITKALSKDKNQRYSNAHEFQIALERFIHSRGEFLSDRDIGNYLKKLFSESAEQIDELREMASGIKSRILVPAKTSGAPVDPGAETRVSDVPASEADTRAVPTLDEETVAAAQDAKAGPARSQSVPPPKRTASMTGNREPSMPAIKLTPVAAAPPKPASGGALKWLVLIVVLGALGAGGWFGWQWYQEQQAPKAPADGAAPPTPPSDTPTPPPVADPTPPKAVDDGVDAGTAAVDAGLADAGALPVDAGVLDVGQPDVGQPDVGGPDTTGADTTAVDAGALVVDPLDAAVDTTGEALVPADATADVAAPPADTATAVPSDLDAAAASPSADTTAQLVPDTNAPTAPDTNAPAAPDASQPTVPDAGTPADAGGSSDVGGGAAAAGAGILGGPASPPGTVAPPPTP